MKLNRVTVFISGLILILTLGLDQWTKWAVVKNIALHQRIEMIHKFFYLTYVQNTGAGFSILEGAGTMFFMILTIIVLGFILYFYITSKDMRMHLALTFVFSGAVGNLWDRLQFGYVRDFFSFYIFGHAFPVFNVADICITLGFISILFFTTLDDYKEKKRWKEQSLKS